MEILFAGLLIITGVLAYMLFVQRERYIHARQSAQEQQKTVQNLEQKLASKEREYQDMQAEMAKCDEIILRLRRAVASHDSDLVDLRHRLAVKEDVISNLRGQIAASERDSIQSKALFSTIANVAYDQVFVLDEDLTIIAMNRAASALFDDNHPIGEKLTEVLEAPELDDIVQRATTEAEGLEEQFVINRQYYRVRTQVMRYDGQHVFIGVALQDITQLVRLNRARRDMVANISHELRTPITNIRIIIESLFYDQDKPKRKASIASLKAIARETDSLLHLVQELLDLSMIESGQAIMRLIETPLAPMIDECVSRLQDQLERKSLKIAKYVPARINVLCDQEHTRRVILNLIRNAIKWSPEDEVITINATTNDEEVTISILDNGPGVPEDQRERIFERFYQVDTSRSGDTSGSGLGLAICKHVIEAHGGRIWAEGNTAGGGGRFLFTLIDAGRDLTSSEYLDAGQHDSGLNMLIGARYNVDTSEIESENGSRFPNYDDYDDEGVIEFEDEE